MPAPKTSTTKASTGRFSPTPRTSKPSPKPSRPPRSPPKHAEVTKIASTYTKLEGSQANAMMRLLETIEDLDDTQNVYSNFDMDEAASRRQHSGQR